MAKRAVKSLPSSRDALAVLGNQIRAARRERGWTASELAERIGVSAPTVFAVEGGAPGTAIGTVFNAATMVGVPLFGTEDRAELARMRRRGDERLALMPSRVHRIHPGEPDDDF